MQLFNNKLLSIKGGCFFTVFQIISFLKKKLHIQSLYLCLYIIEISINSIHLKLNIFIYEQKFIQKLKE